MTILVNIDSLTLTVCRFVTRVSNEAASVGIDLAAQQEAASNVPIVIHSTPNAGWLLQPVMSYLLFKFVPLPFQVPISAIACCFPHF